MRKRRYTLVEISCEYCGKVFKRRRGAVTYNKNRNINNFCSHSCCTKYRHSKNPVSEKVRHIKYYFYITKLNCEEGQLQVTLEDLIEQYDKQLGLCPYTGWKLDMRTVKDKFKKLTPNRASLDRIDSSKPYSKDNIEFVSCIAQYTKNSFTKKEVLDFCLAVDSYHSQDNIL